MYFLNYIINQKFYTNLIYNMLKINDNIQKFSILKIIKHLSFVNSNFESFNFYTLKNINND